MGLGPRWQPATNAQGRRIGWVDGCNLYLEPETSYAVAQDLARQAPRTVQTLLIVGHDPGIPDLAFLLAGHVSPAGGGGSGIASSAAVVRMRAKFPTAAIAVLELTGTWRQLGPGTARLASFVIPRDLRTAKPAATPALGYRLRRGRSASP